MSTTHPALIVAATCVCGSSDRHHTTACWSRAFARSRSLQSTWKPTEEEERRERDISQSDA